jgi:hypothetical protein
MLLLLLLLQVAGVPRMVAVGEATLTVDGAVATLTVDGAVATAGLRLLHLQVSWVQVLQQHVMLCCTCLSVIAQTMCCNVW